MAIVKQYDKRSGITYAYEAAYHWDKEKKQSRCTRKLIGWVDDKTGDIIPADGRGRKDKTTKPKKASKHGPVPAASTRHRYYGATYLLEKFADKLGLTSDLKACFPDTYKKLLSIAFYLILEGDNPLYRFEKWHLPHKHPCDADVTSPRSSELFPAIKEDRSINSSVCRAGGVLRMNTGLMTVPVSPVTQRLYRRCSMEKTKKMINFPGLIYCWYLKKNQNCHFITGSWQGIYRIPGQ